MIEKDYGFTAEDVWAYRQDTGASMMEAKKHFMNIYYANQKAELLALCDSGEDLTYVLKTLIEKVYG